MTPMLEKIIAERSVMDGEQDNLLKAMGMLAASGHISIIPKDQSLTTRPVILLPQNMYDRLIEITKEPK